MRFAYLRSAAVPSNAAVPSSAAVLLGGALLLGLSACAPEPSEAPHSGSTGTASEAAPMQETSTPERTSPGSDSAEAEAPENPGMSQEELDSRLRQSAWADDVESARQLIGWGANVNAKDRTQQSAYLIATSEGHLDFLRLTLEHGAKVKSLDSWNGTGLIRAAERGHWDIVGRLIQARVPLDHVNRIGYQAIHEAVWLGRDDASYHATLRVLIAGGVQFDRPSVNEGLTPLQMAEQRGFRGSARLLRELAGAKPPKRPTGALLAAARDGRPNDAVMALRAGADPRATDAQGRTALQLAEAGRHVLTAQIIRALGG